jgi:23S rRNA (guanosine2251-2'-O)-methyltransferase
MRPLVEKTCDVCVSIPLQTGFDSLNASTAGAVVLFEAMRQRMPG